MKAVFMGTPDFSVGTLNAMYEAGHEIAAVFTQPDKQKGRGKSVLMTPVKEKALELGIPVYQPVKLREQENYELLKSINPDVIVVVAYGQLISKEILDLPRYGCINVHASLLPKYRGAAPIQWAVIDGEHESGVTTMKMDEKLDTGDMIMKTVVELDSNETGGSLHDKLADEGAKLLVKTLKAIEDGTAIYTKQDDSQMTYAKKLTKELGHIDFSMDAKQIERLIRGLNPWPSAYTSFEGKTLKIWAAKVSDEQYDALDGTIVEVSKNDFTVKTAQGSLIIKEVQLEGKKRMDAGSFLRGTKVETGTILR
ncbi:methionyl-tRNA formyltransferase [Falcatimonas sp. MSJ-15]|uniref:methionyl-tRNA formyltransferase n=1 Tax=Falcatimonas sp. MSJ-15 TaxID=2841515 RepID=UPI001C1136DB|nr:methionyl-tRNA formyltransferase [Falcatimonas sp. MSJ-15]MBU5469585.1 methionyl-tRNA formyltransferase [Falcatimonas sp. MSJ-15]